MVFECRHWEGWRIKRWINGVLRTWESWEELEFDAWVDEGDNGEEGMDNVRFFFSKVVLT